MKLLLNLKVIGCAALSITGEFNKWIPEDKKIVSFFVNNFPNAEISFKFKIKLQYKIYI